jgi:sulfhydrogenase subunit beta (sulfur reductase)
MVVYVMGKDQLDVLFDKVQALGYEVIAPKIEEGVLRLGSLDSNKELAKNVLAVQSPGKYHTESSDLMFSFTHGPDSPKWFLYPSKRKLWKMTTEDGSFELKEAGCESEKVAFFGIKPCDLASIEVFDRTLMKGEYVDEHYMNMRDKLAVIVANCIEPSGTCFCHSMGTGPKAKGGFDLSLTELSDGFLVESGSKLGDEMLSGVDIRPAKQEDVNEADSKLKGAEDKMGRTLDVTNLKEKLYSNLESPAFREIAKRCLGCANCTNECPTCFCTMYQDVPSLDGKSSERSVAWDSCFTYQFAQVAGGHFRSELWARYRQWMVHKFAYWLDQFGVFGCIGCGRCITWCPVGIDVTESVREVQEVEQR